MEFIQKNKSIIIAILVVLVFSAGLIFCLARPLHKKVQEQKDLVEQGKYELDDIRNEGGRWKEYMGQRENFEKNKYLIENSSVSDDSQINLIERLEQIAKEEDVTIDIQGLDSFETEKKGKSNDKSLDELIIYSLTVNGGYNEILDYIYKIENLNYVLSIFSVNIKTRSTTPSLRDQTKEEDDQRPLQAKVVISFIPQK